MFDKFVPEKIKAVWHGAKPSTRHVTMVGAILLGIVIAGTAFYFYTPFHTETLQPVLPINAKTPLSIDNKMLEKSDASQLEAQKKDLDELRKLVEKQNGGAATPNGATPSGHLPPIQPIQRNAQGTPNQTGLTPLPSAAGLGNAGFGKNNPQLQQGNNNGHVHNVKADLPPIPVPYDPVSGGRRNYPQPPAAKEIIKEEVIGGIGHAKNSSPVTVEKASSEDKKKARHVYLPPSFMEAHLLSGLNAPVTQGGKSNPVPVIIRVAAPAQLPNDVKMGLQGCFVIGEAVGDLAQERALVRLVSISCLSKNGNAVIDQQITGFVQDSDSKPGLAGNVVAKFGSKIARAFLGGLAAGIGNAATTAATTTTVSPLGATAIGSSSLKDIGLAGVGGGISKAATEIDRFYMDLAHQSMPVIECGNGKKITLIITKGVSLEIKDYAPSSWY